MSNRIYATLEVSDSIRLADVADRLGVSQSEYLRRHVLEALARDEEAMGLGPERFLDPNQLSIFDAEAR